MLIFKSEREVEGIRASGSILVEIMCRLKEEYVKEGISLREIDRAVRNLCSKFGVRPAFLGYRGFPASVCLSINEEVIHGIPDKRTLKEGDILSIDIGIEKDGFYSDAARTFPVGEVDEEKKRLIEVTKKALFLAIDAAKAGNRVFDISRTIYDWVVKNGYNVVKDFTGHGVGIYLHEEPQIPNFVPKNGIPNTLLRKGMVIAIEPMVNMGGSDVVIKNDGWTVITRDSSLSAHFEDTIYIAEDHVENLTEGCYG